MRLSPFSPILRAKPRGPHAGTGHDALEVTRYISYGIAGGDPVLRRREGGDDRKSPMSGLGQTRKSGDAITTSALPPTADISESGCDVRKVLQDRKSADLTQSPGRRWRVAQAERSG